MWEQIEPLMPADPARGRRWADHRRTLEAIAWKYRTGAPWRDLPKELGPFQTAHKRLLRWAADGTWQRIFHAVLATADASGEISWTVSVDSTVCRAHQHAAGARKGSSRPRRAGRPRTRSFARRAEYESSPGQRCQSPATRVGGDSGAGRRRPGIHGRHGRDQGSPSCRRTASYQARNRDRGSRVLGPRDPLPPA